MLTELASKARVAGVKQSRRAIREGSALQVFLACDADPAITSPLAQECRDSGIPVECGCTMLQLGQACGIAVGASVVTLLNR